jgi:signal transduction histidine kinase
MQLTKKLEAEILQQNNAFWEANLGGNMEIFASYLVDDFSIFGSANGEVFFNKPDAVGFNTATAEQLVGKAQLRNRNTSIRLLDENNVVVLELCDLYVLIESEWAFYGNARITCIMEYTGGNWKAVHQHASFPDHRTEEGEQLATEKIEKENLELREAVKRRTVELESKNRELKNALINLKAAQAQLIQSEKMASLGELTAGIAHEIQNPLNFVNNFSDVNTELVDEASQEINKGNIEEAKAILKDIKDNEQKIDHHGKRADTIVKGMLQHSQNSIGITESTDINALCDEYLRLAYHGLKARNNCFNVTTKTDFDETLSPSAKALSADKAGSADDGKINIIPQDIGRVLLNLYNNAFYEVNEKSTRSAFAKATADELADSNYEPTVWVSTKKMGDKVFISVKDNGPGIPQKILDKIFQPFFTTKPTGQGTGLGLSLAYDIVKAHGGEIKVETKIEEGSEFIVQLNLKSS